jgi:hypothetical protein
MFYIFGFFFVFNFLLFLSTVEFLFHGFIFFIEEVILGSCCGWFWSIAPETEVVECGDIQRLTSTKMTNIQDLE